MNLQQLYYFQAISRLKNYTKAAEQLLVAQSPEPFHRGSGA